jgi:haloalkane dehalogenase
MEKRTIEVLGQKMAYAEAGSGAPIVLLHGNPTSSFLWRSVIPHLAPYGRCLAPDLIGMGDSDKLPESERGSYRFVEHRRFLDAWFEAVGATEDLTLILHDWGSALGFDWAARHPDAVRAICYMEAIVSTITWDDWPNAGRSIFQAFRSDQGEEMVLDRNLFVEVVLPASIIRKLTDVEMDEYRRPFVHSGEDRRPTLTWPQEIPVNGQPADVAEIVEHYAAWLATTAGIRKLFINAEPGSILTGRQRQLCRGWPNQSEITVPGIHFIQEDSGDKIGASIASWLAR